MDINFRFIKVLDIGYITVLYFIIGVLFTRVFDYLFGKYDKLTDKNKHIIYIGLELIVMIWVIGIATYIVRNIVEIIPSPFDGINGLVHKNIKELCGAGVFSLIVMSTAYHFRDKLDDFNKRLNKLGFLI
jgi:hypothetical protein